MTCRLLHYLVDRLTADPISKWHYFYNYLLDVKVCVSRKFYIFLFSLNCNMTRDRLDT